MIYDVMCCWFVIDWSVASIVSVISNIPGWTELRPEDLSIVS